MANNFVNPWGPGGEYWRFNALHNNVLEKKEVKEKNQNENKPSITITTVKNVSKNSIWCKNEDDDGVFEVKSKSSTNKRIDGLTHWTRKGEVFKVFGNDYVRLDALFGITVYDEGFAFDTAFWPIDKDINELAGGGWITSTPDKGWDKIFEKSNL